MATQTLTADAVVADGVTYVSSATAGEIKAFLASDFDEGDVVRFESTADAAAIVVCDSNGAILGYVPGQRAAVAVLDAKSTWNFYPLPADSPAAAVAAAAGTDAAIIDAVVAVLVNAGLMKAE